ncbi:MAG TPA: helix-turn-helix transcriptional regulator [Candidatus Avoscillospira avicola]|uniref:Helix-turn-helix transcriptional regulator n=1 Tax=Candidatus Avoscillospira avicola TaxID=2840706 RepID=A0A9D1IY88_9FIRM|nr:helix-turn-helix transcriptional regulator [Candidatus Avoscillospira avicola]
MTLGNRLQRLRQRQGLSQDALAEKLGVSRQAVSKWERDEAVPEVEKLLRLSELYGVSLDELVKGDATQSAPQAEPQGESQAEPAAARRERPVWEESLQWGGLVGGGALLAWGLGEAALLLLLRGMVRGWIEAAAGATTEGLGTYVYDSLNGAEDVVMDIAQGSANLFLFPLLTPVLKALGGAVLLGLGIWALRRGRRRKRIGSAR